VDLDGPHVVVEVVEGQGEVEGGAEQNDGEGAAVGGSGPVDLGGAFADLEHMTSVVGDGALVGEVVSAMVAEALGIEALTWGEGPVGESECLQVALVGKFDHEVEVVFVWRWSTDVMEDDEAEVFVTGRVGGGRRGHGGRVVRWAERKSPGDCRGFSTYMLSSGKAR
jgi:hypothetical protein